MATVEQKSLTVAEALENAFARMGDLSNASVTVIDHMGDFSGNEKSARLMEVFQTFSNGRKEITIVTGDLGQDSAQHTLLFGRPPGLMDSGPGLLQKKFGKVESTGLRFPMLPALAEMMIGESALGINMQLGLKVIVDADIAKHAVSVEGGIGGLRHLVNGYLKRPLTPEWSAELMAKSPFTQALDCFTNGPKTDLDAPARATFLRKGRTP
jgi:hypothetical protein